MTKNINHEYKTIKRLPWPVCRKCGLVLLKNERTRQAARKPCDAEEDDN